MRDARERLPRIPDQSLTVFDNVAPTELSFISALHYLQHEWRWFAVTAAGKLPVDLQLLRKKLATALRPQTRRGRECPRVVKALPQRYAVKKLRKAS